MRTLTEASAFDPPSQRSSPVVYISYAARPHGSANRDFHDAPWAATPADTMASVPPDRDRTAEPIDLAAVCFPDSGHGFNSA